jgi:hypothetical protein
MTKLEVDDKGIEGDDVFILLSRDGKNGRGTERKCQGIYAFLCFFLSPTFVDWIVEQKRKNHKAFERAQWSSF